ncbi:unnamed protein product [Ixodes hexagonus]
MEEEETPYWGQRRYSKVSPRTQFTGNKTLLLRCEQGYEYNGQDLIKISCSNGIWDLPRAMCTGKPCRDLPKVNNAVISGPVAHGEKLVYKCQDEQLYRLINHEDAPHCHLGKVEGRRHLPKCKPTFCDQHGFPKEAAQLELQRPLFHDGEYLKYECRDGFNSTNSQVKCTDGGWAAEDDKPFCKPSHCRLQDIPQIENGTLEGVPNITHSGVVRYKCNDNYALDGPHSITCLFGKWSGPRPSCVKHRASPSLDMGSRRDERYPTSGIEKHAPELYGLNPGSTAEGLEPRSCKFPIRQNRFHAVAGNVRVLSHDNVSHGTVLRFHCQPLGEIRLGGHESSQCLNGSWSKVLPYCYDPAEYDVVIKVKDPTLTAVSPDGYLIIRPGIEIELECTSIYYKPRLVMNETVPTWSVQGEFTILLLSTRNVLKKTYDVSAKFILHEGYEGIVGCSNGKNSHIIRIRGRYLWSCTIPAHSEATVVERVNREIATVKCIHPYVRVGGERAYCLAHGEWRDPFPRCVLPAQPSISNKPGNTSVHSTKRVPDQSTNSQLSQGSPNSTCKVLPIEDAVYRRHKNSTSRQISPNKEFTSGTAIYLYCGTDGAATEIRCWEGLWKPSPTCSQGSRANYTSR